MTVSYRADANMESVSGILSFLNEHLKVRKDCNSKSILKAQFLAEEIVLQMIRHAKEHAQIKVSVVNRRSAQYITVTCKGRQFRLDDSVTVSQLVDFNGSSEEEASVLSGLILKSYASAIDLKHSGGFNKAVIRLTQRKTGSLASLLCLTAGILFGLLTRLLLPQGVGDALQANLFSPIASIFIRLIQMAVGPLVFFSLAESILGFSDLKAFGRISIKTLGFYVMTTCAAVSIGTALFLLFSPGDPAMLPLVERMIDNSYQAENTGISIVNTLVGFAPTNLLGAFVNNDMMQIIVIAVLFGIASGAIGEYSAAVQNFVRAGNALFAKIVSYIVKMLPLAVFSMMFSFVYIIDTTTIRQVLRMLLGSYAAMFAMLGFYSLLLAVLGRVSPLKFFAAFRKAMLVAFSTCSSSVTMPSTMDCLERMGVSPKVYSFTIPLGATINMDGASIEYVFLILFAAKIFGVPLTPGLLFSLALSVIICSMATPCVVGSSTAFYIMLLSQIGIPAGVAAFLIPLGSIIEFGDTIVNVCGDASISTVVAQSEGLLEEEKYFRRP